MTYTLVILPEVEKTIQRLNPELKRTIRAALEFLRVDPHLGKPLRDRLEGLWSFRVRRYRIIYRIAHHRIEVQVIDIGPRDVIYERIVRSPLT